MACLESRNLQSAEQAAHLLFHGVIDLAVGVVDGGDDQILQHADIILRHHFRIDHDPLQVLVAVDGDRDHAAARSGLHRQLRHFPLQALLHFLRLLHHVLDPHQRSSTVVFSTGKISSSACTVEFDIASAFTSSDDAFGCDVADCGDADAGAGCAPASATTTVTGTGLPPTFSAIDASHAFCSSHCPFAFF